MTYTITAEDEEMLMCLRRSFAMMALAMLSHQRELLTRVLFTMPDDFKINSMPEETARRLYVEVMAGNVTTMIPNPEPAFSFIIYKGTFGSLRTVFGIWMERQASWKGTSRGVPDVQAMESFGKFLADNPSPIGTPEPEWLEKKERAQ